MELPKVIKFKNGELVVAFIRESDTNELFWLDNPIAILPHQVVQEDMIGETYLLRPWIGITAEKNFLIPKSAIITVCSLSENLIEQYKRYTIKEEKTNQESNLDTEILYSRLLRSKNLLN